MKIDIKTTLKNKEGIHSFKGKAIKNKNIITYQDQKVLTKIKLDDIVTIERKDEYIIDLHFKKGIKLKGSYNTKYGNIDIETQTKDIIKKENTLEIIYDLIINNEYIDTFTYYCEYSIDS